MVFGWLFKGNGPYPNEVENVAKNIADVSTAAPADVKTSMIHSAFSGALTMLQSPIFGGITGFHILGTTGVLAICAYLYTKRADIINSKLFGTVKST